jgi:tRNA 2-thiouridine synthesizing protein B
MRVFLLTKTPNRERTGLCLRLVAGSEDAVVYLAGDGVYNLLGRAEAVKAGQAGQDLVTLVARDRILACREDLEARGISAEGKATVPVDFYESLVDDMMGDGSQVYSF